MDDRTALCWFLAALVFLLALLFSWSGPQERRLDAFLVSRSCPHAGNFHQSLPIANGDNPALVLRSLRDELESGRTARQALVAVFGQAPSVAIDQDRQSLEVWLKPRLDEVCPKADTQDRRLLDHRLALALSICEESGSPLVPQIDALLASQAHRRMVRSRRNRVLAVPRATVRLFAILPFVLLSGGWLFGADPFKFLFSAGGAACGCVGLFFIASGVVWYRKVLADYERNGQ